MTSTVRSKGVAGAPGDGPDGGRRGRLREWAGRYLATGLLGDLTAGIVAGKLAADVVFYGIAVLAYELRKRHLPMPRPSEKAPNC